MSFVKDTASTEIYADCPSLSLRGALPILLAQVDTEVARRRGRGIRIEPPETREPRDQEFRAQRVGAVVIVREPLDRARAHAAERPRRSEEHTSELQSLMRNSYAVFCLKKQRTLQLHT